MITVLVDNERCCSSGQCAALAPEVFDQSDDDGRVVLLDATPPEDRTSLLQSVADLCPSRAITVVIS